MGTLTVVGPFQHDSDCVMSGCPGHLMEVEHQNTADIFSVRIDGKAAYVGDVSTTIRMLGLMKRFEDLDTSVV